jgi:hypothetical protein
MAALEAEGGVAGEAIRLARLKAIPRRGPDANLPDLRSRVLAHREAAS